MRIATFNTELKRDGPGLLFRDLLKGEDPQIEAIKRVIGKADPDILTIQSFDYDYEGRALALFAEALGYPHFFAAQPNAGRPSGADLDGDGRTGGPGDAQGYGTFSGQGGMAILSRYPILVDQVQDYADILWADLDWATLPQADGQPFPSPEAQAVQRLSTTGHWVVPVAAPSGILQLLTFHASPPVFDGPEDRNGLRNHDEIRFWLHLLDGPDAPETPFVLLGDANLDPAHGEGRKEAIRDLLSDPRLQAPEPLGSSDANTVDWSNIGVGRMRVDYVLPSTHWMVVGSGVVWPDPADPFLEVVTTASRHRLVWVDLKLHP